MPDTNFAILSAEILRAPHTRGCRLHAAPSLLPGALRQRPGADPSGPPPLLASGVTNRQMSGGYRQKQSNSRKGHYHRSFKPCKLESANNPVKNSTPPSGGFPAQGASRAVAARILRQRAAQTAPRRPHGAGIRLPGAAAAANTIPARIAGSSSLRLPPAQSELSHGFDRPWCK